VSGKRLKPRCFGSSQPEDSSSGGGSPHWETSVGSTGRILPALPDGARRGHSIPLQPATAWGWGSTQPPRRYSASDTPLMNIFLFINQQTLNTLLSNSSLSHYLVSRCNGQVKTCAFYLDFFLVCLLPQLCQHVFPWATRSRARKCRSAWVLRTRCS